MKRLFLYAAFVFCVSGAVFAQSDLQPIANVKLQKTEPITVKQLKSRVEALQKELGRVMTVEERKQVLDTLINERLVVQAAEKDGLKITDSEVNQNFIQMISQQFGKNVTESEFAQLIKEKTGLSLDEYMKAQNGMSLVEYKSFLKSQLLAQRYVLMKRQDQLRNLPGPSDPEIRKYYELYKQNFVQPDMVKIFLVVVPKADSSPASREKLTEMHRQLIAKPAVAAELKIRAQAEKSGFQAGDLYINKNATAAQNLGISMDALLKIFDMGVNQVSDITETDTDFQCFIVQEKFPVKILDLSDVVRPGTTVTVYEYIKNNMLAQSQNAAVNEALVQVINDLRQPDNFQILKSGSDLDKTLSW